MKQIVITGASSGIGAAAARSLAHHELILVGRNAERLAQIAAETGGTAIIADLTSDLSVAAVADAVGSDATERVLINAAGISHFNDSAEMPWGHYADQLAINLTAPLRLTHALLPWLLGGSGQLVNVLSIAATQTFSGAAAYAASKAGLLAAGRSLAAEYRKQGLRYMAGLSSKSGKVAMIGGDDVPSIRSTFKAFKAGAEAAKPGITVIEVFTGSGQDIAKAKQATLGAISEGADFVIHQANAAAQGVFDACKEKGIWAFGANLNQNDNASGAVVASATIVAGPAFLNLAKSVKDGSFKNGIALMGMDQGAIDFVVNPALQDKLAQEVVTAVEETRAKILSGELTVPKDEF